MMNRSPSSSRKHAERGVEETTLESELHQHQQHREADPGNRAHKAQLVRDEIAPGERDRAHFREKRDGVGCHAAAAPQKISAGSARRNLMSDSIAEMTDMKTPTAKTPASCIGAIVTGSSVWARITE